MSRSKVKVTKDKRQISLEPLNGFATNSHGRLVWSLARLSLMVKGQGHQDKKTAFFSPFSGLRAICFLNIFSL